MDGFDSKKEMELKSRKRRVTELSEVGKWSSVYRILFPDVPQTDIPSPFYDYFEANSEVPSGSLSDYEEYAHREIDRGLRETLEHELETDLQITDDLQKAKAIRWFKKMQLRLLHEFKLSRGSDSNSRDTSNSPQDVEMELSHPILESDHASTASFLERPLHSVNEYWTLADQKLYGEEFDFNLDMSPQIPWLGMAVPFTDIRDAGLSEPECGIMSAMGGNTHPQGS
ncbi:uncharacterized protein GGS25DRAFT_516632 [Hypoxylon fragiforme]|uniref:uncharacterized protein n=1 Tax=Hypoxylon fragiforme TaxID=63214 RepID=UPI0020C6C024|nr:uncharacterized protein GGS25DRAFT_516632 [Hypoxylon fragiforme]KAI2613769.1 hypothetical protein GGS25DRAFT_516632 [Hypoxylon fragiforme]